MQAALEKVAFGGGSDYCPEGGDEGCIVVIDGPGGSGAGGIYLPPTGGGGGHNGGGGVGGGSNTGDGRNVYGGDDGTRGDGTNFNRFKWGCDRENMALFLLAKGIYDSGNVVGIQLPIVVTDPNYTGGQWIKVEADTYSEDHVKGQPPKTFFIRVHYMYNVTTHQMHQIKFKTSYESGCIGK
jgi:hypothetical protein